MAREVFIDTSGFYALLVKRDDRHRQASDLMRDAAKKRLRFVTTDYVLDETATLLQARGHIQIVNPFFASIFESRVCRTIWTDADRFEAEDQTSEGEKKQHALRARPLGYSGGERGFGRSLKP